MKRKGASIIFINDRNQVLLFLRDDKPEIPYPNMWDVPGGHVEKDETPRECIIREMKEEIDIELKQFQFFKSYDFPDREEHMFWKKENLSINTIHLTEGQCMKWFTRQDARQTELACGFNQIVEEFFMYFLNRL
ncbi:MAG: NUDIX hydrolase [Proteobacteria bacterium]|nr:NUDIX hydrolase [Pseudomonadota bacterium]